MSVTAPPQIFSARRRELARSRSAQLQTHAEAARYLAEDAAEDILDRLSFLRHSPGRALVIGDQSGLLGAGLVRLGAVVTRADSLGFAEEQPWPQTGFDFIASLFSLDRANDLPGALIHMRAALAPGGLAIAVIPGAGSLPVLRQIMLAADGDCPAPRLHPQVDVRAGGQLLQRAGYAQPVTDSRSVKVRFGTLRALVTDIRAQGLGNVLSDPGPALGKAALSRAKAAFAAAADDEGRVTETFEILTLSGWRL